MVIECGTNLPGEIARLARIVEPDVALVLNAEIEHTEGLGTLEGVADEEAALFGGARQAVVTWAEDRLLTTRIPPTGVRAIFFGTTERADVRLVRRSTTSAGRSQIRIQFRPAVVAPGAPDCLELELSLLGPAAALNASAAIAAVTAINPLAAEQLPLLAAALRRWSRSRDGWYSSKPEASGCSTIPTTPAPVRCAWRSKPRARSRNKLVTG